ncbi:hypothetical protein HC022_26270 [Salipiger sp. HF18]|uniref:hypothetical protein n=1 Tax=Salipiger sp. HF18 TaxID=2721557 RepID=UPI00142E5FB9|nr:hypothetical protein [Salipiger sp. HF18]NIY99589.1 hypothetical protein [Salipiger sp. HF18]
MTRRELPPRLQPDEPPNAEFADDTLYLHFDGVARAKAWKIADYGDDGALDVAQMREIKERFDLEAPLVVELSRQIGYCLDRDTYANFIDVVRSKASKQGGTKLRNTLRFAKACDDPIKVLREGLQVLESRFGTLPASRPELDQAKELLQAPVPDPAEVIGLLKSIAKVPGAAYDLSPKDMRTVVDRRRNDVVAECARIWKQAGRKASFSTDATKAVEGQIYGPFVDFICCVVVMVTEDGAGFAGRTLRKSIEHARRMEDEQDLDVIRASEPEVGTQK